MFPGISDKLAYFSTWFGFKIGCSLAKVFPRAVFRLADWLSALGYCCFHGFRRRSVNNIQLAMGDRLDHAHVQATARRSLQNFFRACVECALAIEASDDELRARIPLVGEENLKAALAKGNGVLVLSAHLGNFLLVGCRIALAGYSTYVLVNQPREGQFAKLMDEYRLQVRQRTIHARPRRQALKELIAVLRRNQVAVIIADEFRDGDGIEVPFFSGTVIARRGPVTLALRTGAAIVPVCLVRQPDESIKLIIEPELELERSAAGSAQVKENAIRVTQWLERTVSNYPDQWNWMNIRSWVDHHKSLINEEQRLQRAI